MIVSSPVYICDDERCRALAREGRLDRHKVIFTRFDSLTAYDDLLDETSAALAEMHHRKLMEEARRAARFICCHATPTLASYRQRLLSVFHDHGCLAFLHAVPAKPRNLFNPRFTLAISDETGLVVDVGFDSMLPYAKLFGIPRNRIYRCDALRTRSGKHSRSFSARVDMKGSDPLTTPEGQALLKQVQNDPLTKNAASFVQENSIRFYLSGLLDDTQKKPLTNSQKRAEKRMLGRRAQSFSGVTSTSDAATPPDARNPEASTDDQDGNDHPGTETREALRGEQ